MDTSLETSAQVEINDSRHTAFSVLGIMQTEFPSEEILKTGKVYPELCGIYFPCGSSVPIAWRIAKDDGSYLIFDEEAERCYIHTPEDGYLRFTRPQGNTTYLLGSRTAHTNATANELYFLQNW